MPRLTTRKPGAHRGVPCHPIDHVKGKVFCSIKYPDGMGHTTMGTSLFDAAANALRWVEVDRRDFRTAHRFRDDDILRIGVGMVPIEQARQ